MDTRDTPELLHRGFSGDFYEGFTVSKLEYMSHELVHKISGYLVKI